jgi:hypothetical protein
VIENTRQNCIQLRLRGRAQITYKATNRARIWRWPIQFPPFPFPEARSSVDQAAQ